MKLIKEVLRVRDSNQVESIGYIKEYDQYGNLVFLCNYDTYNSSSSKFIYDDNGLIEKETIKIDNSYGEPSEERLKKYEHIENGYRTLEYKTKIIHDSSTASQFEKGGLITPEAYMGKYPVDDNQLLSIEEILLDDRKRIVEKKLTDIRKNEVKLKRFDFENELLTKESHFDIVGEIQTLRHEIVLEYDENGKLISKKEFDYSNGESKIIEHFKYSLTEDKIIEMDEHGNKVEMDLNGQKIQELSVFGERRIYVYTYLPPNHELIESIQAIDIYKDSHKLVSTKHFFYK